MGSGTGLKVFCGLLLIQASIAEWVLKHSNLPEFSTESPETFRVDLSLEDEIDGLKDVSLSLKKSEAVPPRLPLYGADENGEYSQKDLVHLKDVTYYKDLDNQAAISLIHVEGGKTAMRGSLVANNEMYEVEPYHPSVHKRSLGAKHGDHIIKKREIPEGYGVMDYKKAKDDAFDEWINLQKLGKVKVSKSNVDGQSVPHYTVTVFVAIDYNLYQQLIASYGRLGGPGANVMEYICYFIGQQINEVSIRYECIDTTTVSGVNDWTMSVSFVGLYVEQTAANTWNQASGDMGVVLDEFNDWVNARPPGLIAHYMLITGLDLSYDGSSSIIGLAWVGGACRSARTSVNEFYLNSALYAHELGHNLAARHDTVTVNQQYVMESYLGLTSVANRGNNWRFSDESVNYFDDYINFLNSNGINCYTVPITPKSFPDLPYGQSIPLDEQCILAFGVGYTFYLPRLDRACYIVWCLNPARLRIFARWPAALYSDCGPNHWCIEKEQCVEKPSTTATIPTTTTPAMTTTPECPNDDTSRCIQITDLCDPVTLLNRFGCRRRCNRARRDGECICTCCNLGLLFNIYC